MTSTARPLSDLLSSQTQRGDESWGLGTLAGRLVEISGAQSTAVLTAAFGLVLEAQAAGEPACWITLDSSSFFPQDVEEGGVDLENLAVVRVPDACAAGRAADPLTRSGGFGLVVIDIASRLFLPSRNSNLPEPLQTRLLGLAQKHGTAVVVLTEKPTDAPSLSSLVSLRAEARRGPGFPATVEIFVLKDKRRGPGRTHHEVCRGTAGLH